MQLHSGQILQGGKYFIIRSLGQGGFGITYEAEQVLLHRTVAIKEFFMGDCCERGVDERTVIRVGTESQRKLVNKFLNKFIKEAQTIAGFEHPHIIKILDIFEENDTAYYVMEFHSKGSLADLLYKSGPLTEALALKYIRQVASALGYIHEHNTVHLDVKPSNILLNTNGDTILIDFGTSKHYDSAGEQTSTTPIGYSKGYAPLEQYRDGDVKQFTPATDIYALGATLYSLVTAKIPPEASFVYEYGLSKESGITDRIWKTIQKSMMSKRNERPQSIKEFLELLVIDDSTVVVQNGRQSNLEDTVQQVYEEYYRRGEDNKVIKKNPIDGLFLHKTSNPHTGENEYWYEINGKQCTENLKSAQIGAEVFLLYANKSFFYAITRDYLKTGKLRKWDIDFNDSSPGLWECGDSSYFEYWYPKDAHLNREPFKWSGCNYPIKGIKYLIIRESDSLNKLVVIYEDHADLLFLHIRLYTGVKRFFSAYQGEIIASVKSTISRE